MKAITIYVYNLGRKNPLLINAITAATSSPKYQLGYKPAIQETNSRPEAQNEYVSHSQIAGKSLIFHYISDQEIKELNPDDAKKWHDQLQLFAIDFRNFLYQEMERTNLFQEVFVETFLQNTLIPTDKKIKETIEISEKATHQILEKMRDSSEVRVRNQKSFVANTKEKIPNQPNPNTMFATPKNNYFKKAAAEFCIGTILCGTGALLFTIEPISASILIALGLLLYAATLYHVAKGFSEQENQNLKLA